MFTHQKQFNRKEISSYTIHKTTEAEGFTQPPDGHAYLHQHHEPLKITYLINYPLYLTKQDKKNR